MRRPNVLNKYDYGEPSVCIAADNHALYELSKYPGRRMKIAHDVISTDFRAIPLEKASPYVEKFDDVVTRVVESGIPKFWDFRKYDGQPRQQEENRSNDSVITVEFYYLLRLHSH